MHANDVRSAEILRHGAYVSLRVPEAARRAVARAAVPALAARLGLTNEFEPEAVAAPATIAFLRRVDATPGARADAALLDADAVIHAAAPPGPPSPRSAPISRGSWGRR